MKRFIEGFLSAWHAALGLALLVCGLIALAILLEHWWMIDVEG